MEVFSEYLSRVWDPEHRARMESVLRWVLGDFPQLAPRMGWNQPMFTHHGTFIIAFSAAKGHMAAAPEQAAILRFSQEILQAGYTHSKELVRIPWANPLDLALLGRIIEFNISDKGDCSSFWRR